MGAVALVTLAVAGLAGAVPVDTKPAKTTAGDVEFAADAAVGPMRLPRHEAAPVVLTLAGGIRSISGAHPPALRELQFELDKDAELDVKGVPLCEHKGLELQVTRTPEEALAKCRDAIIGKGVLGVQIQFPDASAPVAIRSKLMAINGGVKKGVTTLFLHAYFTVPVPAEIVTTVKATKIRKGRYGLLLSATLPKIAGGSGSVTEFKLAFDRKFTYKGERISPFSLSCPDGRFAVRERALFADGTEAPLEFARPCVPRD